MGASTASARVSAFASAYAPLLVSLCSTQEWWWWLNGYWLASGSSGKSWSPGRGHCALGQDRLLSECPSLQPGV